MQYCSGFCRTSTWICHGCTCVPILNPSHPSGSSQRQLWAPCFLEDFVWAPETSRQNGFMRVMAVLFLPQALSSWADQVKLRRRLCLTQIWQGRWESPGPPLLVTPCPLKPGDWPLSNSSLLLTNSQVMGLGPAAVLRRSPPLCHTRLLSSLRFQSSAFLPASGPFTLTFPSLLCMKPRQPPSLNLRTCHLLLVTLRQEPRPLLSPL